jgi:ADP-ribose pyrophosphatase YjhB (NUDIX family)
MRRRPNIRKDNVSMQAGTASRPAAGAAPYTVPVEVALVVLSADRVLLVKRRDTARRGMWTLPGGGLSADEHVLAAAARQAREEIGIGFNPAQMWPVATVHYRSPTGHTCLGLFFAIHETDADATMPIQPGTIEWFDRHALPTNTTTCARLGVQLFEQDPIIATAGWAGPFDLHLPPASGPATASEPDPADARNGTHRSGAAPPPAAPDVANAPRNSNRVRHPQD